MDDPNDEPAYSIEPLGRQHDRAAFSCGKDSLDRYLKNQARQDARKNVAAPFVLVKTGEKVVRGYYTLSAYAVDVGDLPQETARKLPRYPQIPVTLLGRLALDRSMHGQGLGEHLLINALRRAWENANTIAAAAVIVDAIDDKAARFYEHFGFMPFPDRPDRLFLPMQTIAKLF